VLGRYSEGVTYGELFLQNEYEMSCYNLDEADVGEQRRRFSLYEAEVSVFAAGPAGLMKMIRSARRLASRAPHQPPAPLPVAASRLCLIPQARRMLEKRLPVPAYDMLLKCSHAFNVLDARGAVGVTERADCFATMRALAREVTGVCADAGRDTNAAVLSSTAQTPQPQHTLTGDHTTSACCCPAQACGWHGVRSWAIPWAPSHPVNHQPVRTRQQQQQRQQQPL
jgi:hypothetical protein